jgi:hypothetical protein
MFLRRLASNQHPAVVTSGETIAANFLTRRVALISKLVKRLMREMYPALPG